MPLRGNQARRPYDDLVIIGGLVPSLIIDQSNLLRGVEQHVGTLDLDIGLSLAVLDHELYRTVAERLRVSKFEPDENEQGNRTNQRWKIEGLGKVTVDFLIRLAMTMILAEEFVTSRRTLPQSSHRDSIWHLEIT